MMFWTLSVEKVKISFVFFKSAILEENEKLFV